jgi:hypothetical protein
MVYGTSNLRVADASIMPIHVSAHLMASTYGIAEKVSDIIKARNALMSAAVVTASTTSAASSTSAKVTSIRTVTPSASHSAALAEKASADTSPLSLGAKIGIGIGAAIAAICIAGALVSLGGERAVSGESVLVLN